MGRHKLPAELKAVQINIRMPRVEKDKLDSKAAELGTSSGKLARDFVKLCLLMTDKERNEILLREEIQGMEREIARKKLLLSRILHEPQIPSALVGKTEGRWITNRVALAMEAREGQDPQGLDRSDDSAGRKATQ